MKRIFFTTLVLVFILSLAGTAMAGGAKVPKNLCLTGPGISLALSISKGGKILLGENKIPSFNIQGIMFHTGATIPVAVAGAGYLGETLFQFAFSGAFPASPSLMSIEGQILWDVNNLLAEGMFIHNTSTGIVTGGTTVLTVVDCTGP